MMTVMINDQRLVEDRTRIKPYASRLKVRCSPSGMHIFDRITGLNVFLDEVQTSPTMWATAPRHVSVALTNACDLSCPYCFAPKYPAELKIERLAGWLDELDSHGCLGVGFGGGEPTLYSSLAELCRFTVKRTGLAVTLTTHALSLDDSLAADLAGNVHFVRVSMDGIGATYEALRGHPFAAFRHHLAIVRNLAPFGVNFVVNSRTLPDLDAATALAAEVGATEFLLLPEQAAHDGGGIDGRTAQELRHWIGQYRGKVTLLISEAGSECIPTCTPVADETGLRAYAHIDATGTLKRSSFDDRGVSIGPRGVISSLHNLQIQCAEGYQ